jgi:hypothetical protein
MAIANGRMAELICIPIVNQKAAQNKKNTDTDVEFSTNGREP